ncbi:MAG: metallophosphoesterase [Paludibacteraceae bacterium]|nr:metallophosphoesterase [Paludibacteraceae bacterium]
MKKIIGWIIGLCLLAGGATTCAIRWEAWFGNPPEPEWVGDTIDYQFITFADDSVLYGAQQDTLQFLLLGDIHNSLTKAQMALLAVRHTDIDFWSQTGDWMERPYLYYEQMMYQSLVGTGWEALPVVAIPGNHEYLKGVVKTLPEKWKSIFPNPQNGPARFLGTTYFVDFPQLRLIAIDTDGLHRMSDYTQVAFWLKKTLREAGDKFTIVMMHHPVYSTAKGRQNPLMWLTFYGAMREADVVFSGHDHNYARRTEYYKERFWKKEEPTVFIATNASTKKYPVKENNKYETSLAGEPVYEYILVTPSALKIKTYTLLSGELIDEVEMVK